MAAFPTPYGINITTTTNALATVRRVLQGAPEDLGIANRLGSTLTDADGNSLVFTRTVEVVSQYLETNLLCSLSVCCMPMKNGLDLQ